MVNMESRPEGEGNTQEFFFNKNLSAYRAQ
jgi:hypothetical protein